MESQVLAQRYQVKKESARGFKMIRNYEDEEEALHKLYRVKDEWQNGRSPSQ